VRRLLALAWLLCVAPLASVGAQRDSVQLDVVVPQSGAGQEGPTILVANLLADSKTRELLRNGFTTQIHFRLELWRRGRWFYDPSGRSEWDVFVSYDPTSQLYNVIRQIDNQVHENFGGFQTVTSAEAQFGKPFRAPLRPRRSGRYYYNLAVDVQSLTESDLDALQQWLRGPSGPAKNNPVTAIRSGLGTFLSRALGGDKRHYEQRSGRFVVP
jgi:hypothetical protein